MHRLALLLLPEFSNLGLAAAIEPLFVANWLAQKTLFSWRLVSAEGAPVRASNGVAVPVGGDLASAADCGTVFVLASFEPSRTTRNKQVIRWLRSRARARVELGGIENGSQALAQAGLLAGHRAAVHWDNLPGFQELFPDIRITRQPYSFSSNRVTCAGGAAVLDMMVAWLERLADPDLALEVARHLWVQQSRDRESVPKCDPVLLQQARTLMRANIDDPLSCGDIANRLGVSLRQLERRFRQLLGHSVNREYMLLRVQMAHQYLQQTERSVTEVAVSCGFSSAEYLARVYRREFGRPPSQDRRQSTDAPVFRRSAGKRP